MEILFVFSIWLGIISALFALFSYISNRIINEAITTGIVHVLNTAAKSQPKPETFPCYQCDKDVSYLFADSRCKDCTRLTPEEVTGEPTCSN